MIKRFFVWSDTQIPEHSKKAVSIALQRLNDFKPDVFVNIGDFVDNTCLMGKSKQKNFELSSQDIGDLKDQWAIANEILDQQDRAMKKTTKKVFMMGNHEHRGFELLKKIRDTKVRTQNKDLLDGEFAMGLPKRGYKVFQYNDYFKMGKLYFTHGAYHNQAHARKHIMDFQKSICYGHMHTLDVETHHTPMREVALMGICVGCLSDLNPQWKRGTPSAYDHAFAEGYYETKDGSFWIFLNRIIKGKLVTGDGRFYK